MRSPKNKLVAITVQCSGCDMSHTTTIKAYNFILPLAVFPSKTMPRTRDPRPIRRGQTVRGRRTSSGTTCQPKGKTLHQLSDQRGSPRKRQCQPAPRIRRKKKTNSLHQSLPFKSFRFFRKQICDLRPIL